MYYYLYEIVNQINGKVYVGVHKTSNLEDGYMGSGKILRAAFEKHGKENFEKNILEFFDNSTDMFARERELVSEEFIQREDTYNARRGGLGGFDQINENKTQEERRRLGELGQAAIRARGSNRYASSYRSPFSNASLQREMCERSRTADAIRKRKQTFADNHHQRGSKNHQFGTCWIWHELVGNKKCKTELLPLYLDQGWVKGRKML